MQTSFKLHSPKIKVFKINDSPENEFNNILPVLIMEDIAYRYCCYVFDDAKYKELEIFIENKNRNHWKNAILDLHKFGYYASKNYHDNFTEKYTPVESKYIEHLEKKGLLRKKSFLESDIGYQKYKEEAAYKNRNTLIFDLVNDIMNDGTLKQPNKMPFNKELLVSEFSEDDISLIGFKPQYHSLISLHKLIPHGTILMLALSLWFLKYEKLMKWWKIIGSDTEQVLGLSELLDNNTFLKEIYSRCGWQEEYDAFSYFFKYNSQILLPSLPPKTEIHISGDKESFESLGYVLKLEQENKLNIAFVAVNETLANLFAPNIDILFFEQILDKKGPTELKRRFERAKMLRTKY